MPDRRPDAEVELNDEIERLGKQNTRLKALLADLTDPDPCWYDHHGYCQAHVWMATDPKCPHERAKLILHCADQEASGDE